MAASSDLPPLVQSLPIIWSSLSGTWVQGGSRKEPGLNQTRNTLPRGTVELVGEKINRIKTVLHWTILLHSAHTKKVTFRSPVFRVAIGTLTQFERACGQFCGSGGGVAPETLMRERERAQSYSAQEGL